MTKENVCKNGVKDAARHVSTMSFYPQKSRKIHENFTKT